MVKQSKEIHLVIVIGDGNVGGEEQKEESCICKKFGKQI